VRVEWFLTGSKIEVGLFWQSDPQGQPDLIDFEKMLDLSKFHGTIRLRISH